MDSKKQYFVIGEPSIQIGEDRYTTKSFSELRHMEIFYIKSSGKLKAFRKMNIHDVGEWNAIEEIEGVNDSPTHSFDENMEVLHKICKNCGN